MIHSQSPSSCPSIFEEKPKHRVAGIGCVGSVVEAKKSLPASCELVGVCDINEETLRKCREEDPSIFVTNDYHQIAAMEGCDTVVTFTPNAVHVPIGVACLDGGKNLWLEKPIGISLDQARELVEAKRRSGRHVGVDLEYRFSYMTGGTMRDIICSGEIGEVLSIHHEHYRGGWLHTSPSGEYRTKKETSGLMIMEGIHQIDFFRSLIGDVAAVQTFAAPNALCHYEIPDNLNCMMWFESGAFARITMNHTLCSYDVNPGWEAGPPSGHVMRWGITGTKGSMVADAWTGKISIFHYKEKPMGTNSMRPVLDRIIDYSQRPDRGAGFHDMYGYGRDFLERMASGRPPFQEVEDAFRSEQIARLADESAYQGGVKITIPPPEY